jgi:HAD superfamily hydrolase (TIGR01509 family)
MKAVLFDCDGVLINTEELGYKILSHMLDRELTSRGVAPPLFTREQYVELLSGITYQQFHDKMHKAFKDKTGEELPAGFSEELQEKILAAEDTHMRAIDGVKEMLTVLKNKNIPIAIGSNSGREGLFRKLKKAGLDKFFDGHIYSRDDVRVPKPAPDLYHFAAKKLGGFKANECVVVEDSITGTLAGKASGAFVIGFVGEAHRLDHEAEYLKNAGASTIAHDMKEVTQRILEKISPPNHGSAPKPPAGPSL